MKTETVYLSGVPIELTNFNSPEPENISKVIFFPQYPKISFEIFEDHRFGIHSPEINVNSPSETDTPINVIQWGNVVISFSDKGVYLDAPEVNLGSGGGAPLQLINTDINVVWEK